MNVAAQLDDLHWLLTSPSLLAPAYLPAGICDGDATLGAQWWAQLDKQAVQQTLDGFVAHQPFRLGRYAEALMRAALLHLPHHQLLAHQLLVMQGTTSLGEYDFVLQNADALWHIELAVKVYIALPTDEGLFYVGPGLRDALTRKLSRLFNHQLQLSSTAAGREALPTDRPIHVMPWLRGWMFYRDLHSTACPELAVDHLCGWWRCWGEPMPCLPGVQRWRSLGKADWLAARAVDDTAVTFEVWQQQAAAHFAHSAYPLMVAQYAAPEAGGAELARGMVLPPGWPDADALTKLRTKLANEQDKQSRLA